MPIRSSLDLHVVRLYILNLHVHVDLPLIPYYLPEYEYE